MHAYLHTSLVSLTADIREAHNKLYRQSPGTQNRHKIRLCIRLQVGIWLWGVKLGIAYDDLQLAT